MATFGKLGVCNICCMDKLRPGDQDLLEGNEGQMFICNNMGYKEDKHVIYVVVFYIVHKPMQYYICYLASN